MHTIPCRLYLQYRGLYHFIVGSRHKGITGERGLRNKIIDVIYELCFRVCVGERSSNQFIIKNKEKEHLKLTPQTG